ncbi:ABC transporter permease [Phycisphaera mikurensis]|uniref:Putative polysaccharide ABC transporter permease protein n=1 Tax=Phycisphaera mikurensis (strain NBRC 102666 / KCTC 22515 / FYK2301M01) TaxID=1142394 RepID=I0IBE5_PHYMF|nr:ABC transporter permease [Phycisphaera mikurensis]MBB6442884.1 lipopolysaccharide transport system permease protein [Phycisphaera mikurensis]BAM02583.1 putative polysaccharide ABC transporter permease protein [Phycisphaera mikurensis NBRC 102666]
MAADPAAHVPPPSPLRVHRAGGRRGWGGLWADAQAIAREGRDGRFLAWRLFRRDLKAEFLRSKLGWWWNLADPLILAAVFVFLRGERVLSGLPLPIPYPVWVVLGMLSLQAFLNAWTQPLRLLGRSRPLQQQVPVTPATLLLSQALRIGFDAAFYLPVMGLTLWWTGTLNLPGVLAAAWLYALLVALGCGLGVLMAPLNAAAEDVGKAVRSLNRPLLFLCPTFWYLTPGEGTLGRLNALNPIGRLMDAMRIAAVGRLDAPGVAAAAAGGTVAIAALLAAAALCFHRTVPVIVSRT